MAEQHIEDLFEDRARKGDGAFAIALALLKLAEAQERTARALNKLGLAEAATPLGAMELLAKEVGGVREAISAVAEAGQRLADVSQ